VGMGDELKMKAHPPLKGVAIKNDKNEIYNEFTAYTKAEYREILKNESEGSKE
jgi:hypothetical protein